MSQVQFIRWIDNMARSGFHRTGMKSGSMKFPLDDGSSAWTTKEGNELSQ